jgi:hypothetical protein
MFTKNELFVISLIPILVAIITIGAGCSLGVL